MTGRENPVSPAETVASEIGQVTRLLPAERLTTGMVVGVGLGGVGLAVGVLVNEELGVGVMEGVLAVEVGVGVAVGVAMGLDVGVGVLVGVTLGDGVATTPDTVMSGKRYV
jgi:hypothetical protein